MEFNSQVKKRRRGNIFAAFVDNSFLLLGIAFLGWSLEVVDSLVLGGYLDRFGIQPRVLDSLSGVFTCHWLHGSFPHLISNTLPFIILGGFVLLGGRAMFWKVSFFVALFGGGLLWFLGGTGNHLGASLVIFGYLGFLLARGVFERSALWITISILTLFLYGGMIFGVFPGRDDVSWEGHLFGFISGIAAARLFVPKSLGSYRIENR